MFTPTSTSIRALAIASIVCLMASASMAQDCTQKIPYFYPQRGADDVSYPSCATGVMWANRPYDYAINSVIIHKTAGETAAGAANWVSNWDVGGSMHYTLDKSNGYCFQSAPENYVTWNAGNQSYSYGSVAIEHSGLMPPQRYYDDITVACYQRSANMVRAICDQYGIPKDRSHIFGHDEVPGCPSGNGLGGYYCHHDPGPYWDWNYYMSLVGGGYLNPPYLFTNNQEFWGGIVNGSSGVAWTANAFGCNGVVFADQTGNDMFWEGPPTNYTGGSNASINVQVLPQDMGGASSNHQMQMFWKSAAYPSYLYGASQKVSYTALNCWYFANLSLNQTSYAGQNITRLRLDFDDTKVNNTRFVVNQVYLQMTPRFWFNTSAEVNWGVTNLTTPQWAGGGWNGSLYTDPLGGEPVLWSPTFDNNMIGASNDVVKVKVYPQGGGTSHCFTLYWANSAQGWNNFNNKTSVSFTGKDQWFNLTFPVGQNSGWVAYWPKQFRLDPDESNQGNRWIIDHVIIDHN